MSSATGTSNAGWVPPLRREAHAHCRLVCVDADNSGEAVVAFDAHNVASDDALAAAEGVD